MGAGLKRILECLGWARSGLLTPSFFFSSELFTKTLPGAMIYFTGEISGSSPGMAQLVPGKIIEEASDYFMHAPLGSGDIAQLVELRSCNWVVAISGWMSNCLRR
ncbi:hypothetical protein HAX54_034018 [Datura stramonium]|uniref:Uncharacterized protein n=1 Tax=Datura stramonium TaxID=4076 RepID=A0ABS8VEM5_DATST|nr:hypothetical protein [Datura stramonium]